MEEDASKDFGNSTFWVLEVVETGTLDNRDREIAKPEVLIRRRARSYEIMRFGWYFVVDHMGHTHKDPWIHHRVCEVFPMGKSKSQSDSRGQI
jgi:hypothetical protein